MSLIDIVSNALGGSVIGAVGSAVTNWHQASSQLEQSRISAKLEIDKGNQEIELAKIQIANQQALATSDATKEIALADQESLRASLAADAATYSTVDTSKSSEWLIIVDAVRGLVRPALTAFLTGCSIFLAVYIMMNMEQKLSSTQGYDLLTTLINNLTACTGLAIAWWFGSRPTTTIGGK